MLTLPSGTGKYTTHGPHYAALRSHYAALGPRPNGLRPSGSIMGPSGSIMFGPRAVYFPVSLGQGQHIIPLFKPLAMLAGAYLPPSRQVSLKPFGHLLDTL